MQRDAITGGSQSSNLPRQCIFAKNIVQCPLVKFVVCVCVCVSMVDRRLTES